MDKETTKAITDSKNIFSNIEERVLSDRERRANDEEYRQATDGLYFEGGRRLWLEVVVEDRELTPFLFNWLFNKDDNGEDIIPFGCSLESIHWESPGKRWFKDQLQKFIDEL